MGGGGGGCKSAKPRTRLGCPSRSTFSQAPRKLLLVDFGRKEYGYRTSCLTALQEPTLTVLLFLPSKGKRKSLVWARRCRFMHALLNLLFESASLRARVRQIARCKSAMRCTLPARDVNRAMSGPQMGPKQAICAVRCASQKPPLRCDAFSLRFALSLRKSTAMQPAMGASLRGRCRDVVNLASRARVPHFMGSQHPYNLV